MANNNINFECDTMDRSLSVHEISGISLKACVNILYKMKKFLSDDYYQTKTDIDQLIVIINLQLTGLSKILSPGRKTDILPKIKVTQITMHSDIIEHDDDIQYCTSKECIRINNIHCSCFYISMIRLIVKGTFYHIKILLDTPYEKWLTEQGLIKCLSTIEDVGKVLKICTNKRFHNYEHPKVSLQFTLSDNITHVTKIYK